MVTRAAATEHGTGNMNEDTTRDRDAVEAPEEQTTPEAGATPADAADAGAGAPETPAGDKEDSTGEPGSEETASISGDGDEPIEEGEAQPAPADAETPDPGKPEVVRARRKGAKDAGAGAPDGAAPDTGTMRWYVLHTYSGREAKVRDTIERLIRASGMEDRFGKVLVATEEVAEMKKGKKTVSKRKLFPSYILIEMEMTNETWSLIENVPGVTHFVTGGTKPVPLPNKEVDRILGRMEKTEGIIPEVPFTIGEHVSVIDGPFSEFTGVVDEISPEKGKLKVLVSIFGRETPVELDFLQVKPL